MEKVINKAPIIGFVRYSQKIVFADRDRDVFEPEYFDYRFKIFKDVTLKSFQQQTNQDFVLLLLHSVNMPSKYKQLFRELESENLFLYNVFVEDTYEDFDRAVQESIKYISFQDDVAVTFRIDNDDAIQKDFIQNLSVFLKRDFVNFVISIPIIHIVKRIAEDLYMVEQTYYPANSIGLASVISNTKYTTVMDLGQHHLMNDENSMILQSKQNFGVLMTINGENAINTINSSRAKILNTDELKLYLKNVKIENLDLNCLRIFQEEKKDTKFSLKSFIDLLLPPIFSKILIKLRSYLK